MTQAPPAETTDGNLSRYADILYFLAVAMEYPEPSWLTPTYWATLENLVNETALHSDPSEFPAYPSMPEAFEQLQVEYTRLFINAVPQVIAPPYGSVYLDADGMLYGTSAVKVKQFYHQQGYDLQGDYDIPDSLGHELRFVAKLLEEGKEAPAEEFLDRWFRPWFTSFHQRIRQQSRHPYFCALASLIDFFTKEENDHVS